MTLLSLVFISENNNKKMRIIKNCKKDVNETFKLKTLLI